ncbi:hypothetical protein [Promineifilum sp.]|uniref:hypothetical protein n=1 Tax=Promineifilum sp. TaxID=2664178 RepID=UPI0035B17679
MTLIELLERDGAQIVAEASEALNRSRLAHYAEAGRAVSQERLARLFQLTVQSIGDHNLVPVMDYMAEVAHDRFLAGYAIREVQIAINVLEEAIWNHIVTETPPAELAHALGLVSTVLGAAKDSLARAYVSLASKSKAPSLDLSALFEGSTSG